MSLFSRFLERFRGKSSSPLYDLHPELQFRYPILREMGGMELGLEESSFKANTKFYMVQTWVNRAISVVKNNLAPLYVRVVEGYGQEIEELDSHPFSQLLYAPNPEMGSAELWGEWCVDMLLGGEWGLEAVKNGRGVPTELWPRQPHTFDVRPEAGRKRYRSVAEYHIDDKQGEPYDLPPEEFLHIKFYNPLNIWRGLAPITAVRQGIIIDQLAQSWSALFFRNNARPDFALIAPQGLTRTERDEYLNQLMNEHGGANAHLPIVLEQGITDLKTFSWSPKDSEWLVQREVSRQEVGAIFGVPDEIMGFGKDTYENFDTADRVLWTLTLAPLAGYRDSAVTRWARRHGYIEQDQRVETDLAGVPQLQEDKSEKVNQYVSLVGARVPPQMASDLVGLGLVGIPDGDRVYIPAMMVPLGSAPVEPTRSGRPRNKAALPEYGSAEHEALWKRNQARIEEPLRDMQRALKRFFQDQQNDVLRRLRASREYGRGEFVKNPDRIPPPEALFDIAAWIAAFKHIFLPFLVRVVELTAAAEYAAIGIDIIFDVTRPQVQAGIRHILETVAQKTNDTTWTGLVQLFQEAEAAGEGIPAIQERINTFFGDRKSDYQTERIARTTMTGASNHGALEAWDQSGVARSKTWISALIPDRTRDEHAAAHNQTVGIHEMFTVGGESMEYPGDPNGSAENIINCLCSMTAEVMED